VTPRRLLLSLLLAGAAAPLHAQDDINRRIRSNQERLDGIRQERADLEDQLARLRGRAYTITTELQNIERQKNVTNRMVNELDRQIGSMSTEHDSLTLDLILAQDALVEKRAVLEKRLVDIYKRGPLWSIQVLLAAESFGQLLSRYKYLYLVSRQDRALVSEVEELRDRIGQRRRQHLDVQRELERRREERGDELQRYSSLERRQQRSLAQTRESQQSTTSRLDALARDEARLSDILTNLERERRRLGAAGAGAGAGSIDMADLGTLDWPVEGDILYRYGRAPGPDNTTISHLGIGIRAPVGTAVHAVADGTVDLATVLGTYGPSVLVNHGGGFYTLYLYLSRLDVPQGQRVTRGQAVGLSGGAGSDDGPHVEFQIRQGRDGNPPITLDPENWLRRRR
jgi:septal ring factor EnvC (AmiA/AmiB activator)